MASKSSALEALHEQIAQLEAVVGGCNVGSALFARVAKDIEELRPLQRCDCLSPNPLVVPRMPRIWRISFETWSNISIDYVKEFSSLILDIKDMSGVEKGLRNGQLTYVIALIKIKPEKMVEVLDEIVSILQDYANMMPLELPKKFPLRRFTDHQIELVPIVKPPAQVPYRMTPPELEELRNQLT
ncbi:hypothetical protein AAG906_037074 [Vitis piasezkii]